MRLTRAALLPRPRVRAPLTAAVMTLIASALAILNVSVAPPDETPNLLVAIAVPTLLAGFGLALWRRIHSEATSLIWLAVPMVGTVALTVLNVATHDASAAAQVFICYPVLFAAAQLRPLGAALATGVAVAGEGVVVFSIETPAKAGADFAYVSCVLVAMAILLILGGLHNDRLIAQLERQAAIDPLTGLVTRRVLDDAATCALSRTLHDDGLALILLDIDRFKTINDTYGHPVGDAVLQHAAGLLGAHVRADAVVSRMGGDELAVLLPGCSATTALLRAEALAKVIRTTPLALPNGQLVPMTVSVGVAHAPTHADDLAELYWVADEALYAAKRDGRDRVAGPGESVRPRPVRRHAPSGLLPRPSSAPAGLPRLSGRPAPHSPGHDPVAPPRRARG